MNKNLFIIIFLIFTVQKSFGQDILFMKDSTKITAKILKICPTRIVYRDLSTKEKKHKIQTSQIAKINFRNGDKIIYKAPLGVHSMDTSLTISVKEIITTPKKPGDFIKFNLMFGTVVNSSDCNRPYEDDTVREKGIPRYKYEKIANQGYKMGFNVGCNFLFGKNRRIKHLLGINFLHSKGEFNYTEFVTEPNSTESYHKRTVTRLNIKSTEYFLNVVNGIRITFFGSLHFEPSLTANIPIAAKNHLNGVSTVQETGKPDTYYTITDSVSRKPPTIGDFAFNPKISYEFKNKNYRAGIYAAYNLNSSYKLPWWTFGIVYYPLKKIR